MVGLFARPVDAGRLEVDLRTRPDARPVAAVGAATWVIGIAASLVSGVAYQSRYAAVAFPFFVLLVGLGVAQLRDRRVRVGVLSVLVALGFVGIGRNALDQRTQAGELAAAINADGRPGDVVAFCPDQLGPDTARLLRAGFVEVTFPDFASPQRIDWVDYGARNRDADAVAFADGLLDRAGADGTVWFVWNGQYRNLEGQCEAVATELAVRRPVPDAVRFAVDGRSDRFESGSLFRYPPIPGAAGAPVARRRPASSPLGSLGSLGSAPRRSPRPRAGPAPARPGPCSRGAVAYAERPCPTRISRSSSSAPARPASPPRTSSASRV